MAKFSLKNALAAMAQTQAGMQQGQIAAETELQRRQLQQQERQRQFHATLLGILPQLAPGSKESVIGGVLQQQGNMAQGRPFDYQEPAPVDMSRYQGPFGGGGRPMGGDVPMVGESPVPLGPPAPQQAFGPAMSFPLPGIPGVPPEFTPQVPFTIPLGQPQIPPRVTTPAAAAFEEVPQSVTARVTPRTPTPVPSGQRGFNLPAPFGRLELRGVDPKEAKGILKDIDDTWNRVNSQAFVKDPNTQATLRTYRSQRPTKPVDQWTEEDFQKAQGALQGLNDTAAFLSRGNAQFQQSMDQAEVKQIETDIGKLSGYRADNLQQELIRLKGRARGLIERGMVQVPSQLMAQIDDIELMEQALASGDKPRAGLILGLVRQELTPKPKGAADPMDTYDKLLAQSTRWAGVPPAQQAPYIRRLQQAAETAGVDPSAIPSHFTKEMDEETKQRLQLARGNAERQNKALRLQENERQWRRGFDTRRENRVALKDRLTAQAKEGDLTEQEHARIGELQKKRDNLEGRLDTLREKYFTDIKVGGNNVMKARATDLEGQIDAIDGKIGAIINKQRPASGGAAGVSVRASDGRAYSAGELRSMSQADRRRILRLISPADRLKLLGN